jgi:hypothetical protein
MKFRSRTLMRSFSLSLLQTHRTFIPFRVADGGVSDSPAAESARLAQMTVLYARRARQLSMAHLGRDACADANCDLKFAKRATRLL